VNYNDQKQEKIGKDTFAFLEVHVFECTGMLLPKKGLLPACIVIAQ
jgi:hypothetical protein